MKNSDIITSIVLSIVVAVLGVAAKHSAEVERNRRLQGLGERGAAITSHMSAKDFFGGK